MSNDLQWFRMYHEFATDPKVQMLSETDQRRFIMALCLRCCNGDVTLHDAELAFQLRISDAEWAATKARLVERSLIGEDNKPVAWEKRQYVSDSSKSRVYKHRQKKEKPCNGDVTLQKRPSNAIDTESDTDTDSKSPLPPDGGPDEKPTTVRPVSDWKQTFAPSDDHGGVIVANGRIELVNGTRALWLERFGDDATALALSLESIEIQPNSRTPVAAQVQRGLARIARERHDRDRRYQAASIKNASQRPTSVRDGRPQWMIDKDAKREEMKKLIYGDSGNA